MGEKVEVSSATIEAAAQSPDREDAGK